MSTLIEMPKEMQNRITSRAHKVWGEMPHTGDETPQQMLVKAKEWFIKSFEKLESEKYFQRERDKAALAAMMDENERLLDKIRRLHAPR